MFRCVSQVAISYIKCADNAYYVRLCPQKTVPIPNPIGFFAVLMSKVSPERAFSDWWDTEKCFEMNLKLL